MPSACPLCGPCYLRLLAREPLSVVAGFELNTSIQPRSARFSFVDDLAARDDFIRNDAGDVGFIHLEKVIG